MARMVLITGGCRSGKSRHGLRLVESAGSKRIFIATAPILDAEMEQRIARHREERRGRGWDTIEAPLDLTGAFAEAAGYDVILCDCLTLWVNNLMYTAAQRGETLHEERIVEHCRELITAARRSGAFVVFVTNEVGMGIVPGDADSRRFRDLIGRCNQEMAAAVDEVILMVSGLTLQIKGSSDV